jgi:hypothetical protein
MYRFRYDVPSSVCIPIVGNERIKFVFLCIIDKKLSPHCGVMPRSYVEEKKKNKQLEYQLFVCTDLFLIPFQNLRLSKPMSGNRSSRAFDTLPL